MSLKALLGLADDKLAELYHKKENDPARMRKPILKGIDRTQNQFADPNPTRGRKWWRTSNNIVEFTPPFPIAGRPTHYVPTERFPDYLKHLRAAVEAGELDDSFGVEAPVKAKRKAGTTSGSAWTPERRERFNASVAARKAKAK